MIVEDVRCYTNRISRSRPTAPQPHVASSAIATYIRYV